MNRAILGIVLTLGVARACAARKAVTSAQVHAAIRKGVHFLRRSQRRNGSWPRYRGFDGGATSLATVALLAAGVPASDRGVSAAVARLRKLDSEETYVVALQAMALAKSDPQRHWQKLVDVAGLLAAGQHRRGKYQGMWGYNLDRDDRADNSNTQFALLGLKAANEAGVEIDRGVWERALAHWTKDQNRDGGWGYGSASSYGSMTCAGVASLIICGARLESSRVRWANGQPVDCGTYSHDRSLGGGIHWLTKNFSVGSNPHHGAWYYYYMYALERAGRLSGLPRFGNYDWYREGAVALLRRQHHRKGMWQGRGESEVVATSFALLFLAKGNYPVLVNKLKWDGDWNNNRHDVQNLVAWVSRAWDRPMTWQVVDVRDCGLKDLRTAPVLYVNGHTPPNFTDEQKRLLALYVRQGGYVLAEACCGQKPFDEGFRQLMPEMFPEDEARLRRIERDHAIWSSHYELEPDTYPLAGVDLGGRTRIVFSRSPLSVLWEGPADCPKDVRRKALRMGTNILAYFTGKKLGRDKLQQRKQSRKQKRTQ